MNTSPSPADEALDFTDPDGAPVTPPPSPERLEQARQEAENGGTQLKQAGYLVSITRSAAAVVPPKNGTKYVVLVVEDDGDLAQLLIDIFTLAGYQVRWASNRVEINAELRRGDEIDVVLMDVLLPDADGLQVLKRLRSHPRLAALPVIMMTGKSAAQDVSDGLAAGADGYVTKPFKMSGLVKAVGLVLGT